MKDTENMKNKAQKTQNAFKHEIKKLFYAK